MNSNWVDWYKGHCLKHAIHLFGPPGHIYLASVKTNAQAFELPAMCAPPFVLRRLITNSRGSAYTGGFLKLYS